MKFSKIKKSILSLIVLLALILTSCGFKVNYDNKRLISNLYKANDDTFAEGTAKKIVVPDAAIEQIIENVGAESYFIASTDREKSGYNKFHNPYKKMPMASLTKIMTALIVLENVDDLSKEYYVTSEDLDLEPDESRANLQNGDKLTVKDLLYGLLVPSGNDAATVLSKNVFNNYDNFIIAMNNEAERLGAINTHFDNAVGLDSDYHFSTAYDLFLITREAMKYPIFKEITTCKEYISKIVQSDGIIRNEKWINTNFFVTEELLMSSNVILEGTKTGNTKKAGSCLVLVAKDKKFDDYYISIVLNAKSKRNSYYNTNALLSAITK